MIDTGNPRYLRGREPWFTPSEPCLYIPFSRTPYPFAY